MKAIAYFAIESPELKMTIDEKIRNRVHHVSLTCNCPSELLFV